VAPVRRRAPSQRTLYSAVDHGRPVILRQQDFAPPSRSGSWGTFAESFIRFNERALSDLNVQVDLVSGAPEPTIQLIPGSHAGAIPLRSAQSGAVVAGFVVKPRFGWSGVGAVMAATGWAASPNFLEGPLVPGSARQVPPWVLAGPVLLRLQSLLASIVPGFSEREETRGSPRGRLVWIRYVTESLARGSWHRLPCRYPDLGMNPEIRSYIRWALERVRTELTSVASGEAITSALIRLAGQLLGALTDVQPRRPLAYALDRATNRNALMQSAVRQGLQALGWVADERGLGGGQEMDGIAWHLPLEVLWERYVEGHVRAEVKREGGEVSVGRLGQTAFPLQWSTSTVRSISHLVPDIVVRHGRSIRIVDAKYKAHFAELDENAWTKLTTEIRDAHRADVHQVLAYASLYDADEVKASLVYPLRQSTWEGLHERRRDVARAELFHGSRRIELELVGLPFGRT